MTPLSEIKQIKVDEDQTDRNLRSKPKRLEILVDGYYYDVTDFIPRHPGGKVINYYTEKGEDATQAIQQFHHRSEKKVQTILKYFEKRPATDLDYSLMDPKTLKKHRELTQDFTKLFLEIEKEGLFKPCYWHIALRFILLFLMTYFWLRWIWSKEVWVRILGCILGGLTCGQAGFLGHECGHNGLTGKPKVDRFLNSLVFGLWVGVSGNWWTRNHNKHHAMPQRLHHDIDLETMPLIAYNAKVVKNKQHGRTFWIQKQVWLFLSIDAVLGTSTWRLYLCPKSVVKRGEYFDMFFMALHWYFVLTYIDIGNVILVAWVASIYLFGNFALSHTHTPVTETATHWVEYGLTHTVDVSHNIFVDWWMGWLNYQIEHHLFPTMPQFRAHRVAGRVKAFAEKHELPYRCLGYKEAWSITLKNLKDVAKELADP